MASAMEETKVKPAVNIPTMDTPAVQSSDSAVQNGWAEAGKDIFCGSVAGIVGKVIEYPFDTVKVRLQTQPDHLQLQYTGAWDCFKQSWAKEGWKSFYRGVNAPLAAAALENASLFLAYRLAQNELRSMWYPNAAKSEKLPMGALVTAGAISGAVASLVLTPFELVKCRMQVLARSPLEPSLGAPQGYIAVTKDIVRREGLRGLWRGQLGTFWRETGGGAAWFGGYEFCTMYFRSKLQNPAQDNLPIGAQLASGAVAGGLYNFVLFPADTIKSKIQTGELTGVKPTFTNVGVELFRTRGLAGLYRGCLITVARSIPSSAVIFTIYEYMRKRIG